MVFHKSLGVIDNPAFLYIWQSVTRKSNTKLIMSAARHPQINGLIVRVNEAVQIALRGYSSRAVF
jgi:hypothetical protein